MIDWLVEISVPLLSETSVDGEHLNCEERVLASVQYIYNSMFIKIKPKTIACKKLATSKKKSET